MAGFLIAAVVAAIVGFAWYANSEQAKLRRQGDAETEATRRQVDKLKGKS